MPKASSAAGVKKTSDPGKRELQRRMERTRQSLARTVDEIKETVDHEVRAVKKTVSGVLDYREEFQNEPLVWSLGALSAGFGADDVVVCVVSGGVIGLDTVRELLS